ncbi:porphobilinogen synthase [Candidatus Saganbacteria bacterium CG08_land_8_20_14_0_20_45_16]|uniref:Delta-aminolevulinic acid dehydratase n=1 Tax=Candidatus Saganbacteria bacterium CG08_land_8_20_14_0_20_45_16 TaxID=2014293 RepID=A0A2H0XU72_UNCSA|nr:MAG: porphobilinogen synthase [Candidatus Saganbacteria bacterium CG08_land_8_20_14_0_20_45_16]
MSQFILPYFVVQGNGQKQPIASMPGIYRFSIDKLLEDIDPVVAQGLDKILLFGLPREKDELGTEAFADDGIVQQAVKVIKDHFPQLIVMTDVCLCAYTTQGHCGVMTNDKCQMSNDGVTIDSEATLEALARIAVSHARAGAAYVAPSAMMRGQVRAIRKALDDNSYQQVKIMAYSAKFASSFYGPFREAMNCSPAFGDRRGYQLDPRDSQAALERIRIEIDEGADMVMVKPALAYLDIVFQAKQLFNKPVAAYNVSGEYVLLHGQPTLIKEAIIAIQRAGADYIITYHAKEFI